MTKRAILLSIEEDVQEMSSLLRTLGVAIERVVVQRRSSPHRSSFLGPGKIEEIVKDIETMNVDLVVVNGLLKPSQHHTLEMTFKKECVDRIGVILRIFAEHAHTDEAKRQVTLATLRYEIPFLREWIHKAKSGERPGFLSGGAYATEVYYEHARSHIRRIEDDLRARSQQRELRRKRRRGAGYFLVSLAGYTNAGKSAIMNALCDSQLEVDGRLFSTLSTTTRKIGAASQNILVTDTVGFIKDLPPDLINAFNSTLEEIFLADLVVLVSDVSEPVETMKEKLETSHAILMSRNDKQNILVVGNKIDRLSSLRTRQMMAELSDFMTPLPVMPVSATTRKGIDQLIRSIETLAQGGGTATAILPISDDSMSLISSLHDAVSVKQERHSDQIEISVQCPEDVLPKIVASIKAVGGRIIDVGDSRDKDERR